MRLELRQLGWAALTALALVMTITGLLMPLELASQLIFGACMVAASLLATRLKSRYGTALLCTLTLFTSTRYMLWRATHTLGFHSPGEWLFGSGLFIAECYTWVVMLLSFVQSAWPLQRPLVPLLGAPEAAPKVDVYIPTYNEGLNVVGPSVLAAMAMDYPQDRFRVFILDDGKREEFRAFAEEAGCGYITRDDNKHAKAGNLNEAMKVTDGDLIAILDCDHVPTRAFLQLTVGWFQTDPKLALVQTPHFFYSPDPIQRNLRAEEDMPGEGDLFYDTIQSGNDLWNATFFCGSCAVIRREALESVGGFAFETVTEDAHTALRIQRQGWNTAFLNIRLSAGLATETLGQHVEQRVRWCRGMTQILRIDNPLFGRGLKLQQRLCYMNALLYYQFPLVRVAFLTSPLIYLFFGLNLIQAPAALVFAYAAPHMLQSLIANHRVQGKQRGLFWGEIYETILAFHLVRPALVSFFSPKGGKFNVTDKGSLLEKGFFDADLVKPHLVTVGLLLAGLAFAVARLFLTGSGHQGFGALLLNCSWTFFNLLILFTAIAVGREARQIRAHVRRPMRLPVTLYFDDGRVMDATTENISTGGLAITLPDPAVLDGREVVEVDLPMAGGFAALPVCKVGLFGRSLRLEFHDLDVEKRRLLIQAFMSRADVWQEEPQTRQKAAWLRGLVAVVTISGSTVSFVSRTAWRVARERLATRPVAAGAAAIALVAAANLWAAPPARAEAPAAALRLPFAGMNGFGPAALALGACKPAPIAHFVLGPEVVPTAAALSLTVTSAPAPIVVSLNGQPMATLRPKAGGGRTYQAAIDPAVLLPGDNEIRLAAPGAGCGQVAEIRTAESALSLTLLPLPGVTTPAPPAAAAPQPAAVVRAPPPPPRVSPGPPANTLAAIGWLNRNPLPLALMMIASLGLMARDATMRLQAQARRRLGGLEERPA